MKDEQQQTMRLPYTSGAGVETSSKGSARCSDHSQENSGEYASACTKHGRDRLAVIVNCALVDGPSPTRAEFKRPVAGVKGKAVYGERIGFECRCLTMVPNQDGAGDREAWDILPAFPYKHGPHRIEDLYKRAVGK